MMQWDPVQPHGHERHRHGASRTQGAHVPDMTGRVVRCVDLTPSLPSFPTRVDVPTFPMLVFCRSENEFHKLRTVAPWIYRIAQQGLTTRQSVADALELLREKPSIRRVLTSHRPCWPVFGGNGGS